MVGSLVRTILLPGILLAQSLAQADNVVDQVGLQQVFIGAATPDRNVQEKSLNEINERIRDGSARVVTAEEMPSIVDELGTAGAVREVDVVTTGTFGAMC